MLTQSDLLFESPHTPEFSSNLSFSLCLSLSMSLHFGAIQVHFYLFVVSLSFCKGLLVHSVCSSFFYSHGTSGSPKIQGHSVPVSDTCTCHALRRQNAKALSSVLLSLIAKVLE